VPRVPGRVAAVPFTVQQVLHRVLTYTRPKVDHHRVSRCRTGSRIPLSQVRVR
jgi:hypothetical protein